MARKGYLDEDGSASRPRAIALGADSGVVENAENPSSGAGETLDSRLMDLEPQSEPQFLRAQKRVSVRRGPLPRRTASLLKRLLIALAVLVVVVLIVLTATQYGRRSWRFRLDSSDRVQLEGNRHVGRNQVLEIFGGDISRNLFLIPLEERKRQLEQIPWVESATVMRLLPNRLKVQIVERAPIAYVQLGTEIKLADRNGVVMNPPPQAEYSFPVLLGFGAAEPVSVRAVRMQRYQTLIHDLDSGGGNYSRDLSEIDVTDATDFRITVTDPQGEVLIHLGSSNFLDRYKIYAAHVQEWRRQFQKLDSVDLRYDRQVIVNPDASVVPRAQARPR